MAEQCRLRRPTGRPCRCRRSGYVSLPARNPPDRLLRDAIGHDGTEWPLLPRLADAAQATRRPARTRTAAQLASMDQPPGYEPSPLCSNGPSGEQIGGEPGDVIGKSGVGSLVGTLYLRQLKHRSQRVPGDVGRRGKPPRTTLCYEMAHGNGGMAILPPQLRGRPRHRWGDELEARHHRRG
jgi:hypothetical protein